MQKAVTLAINVQPQQMAALPYLSHFVPSEVNGAERARGRQPLHEFELFRSSHIRRPCPEPNKRKRMINVSFERK
jgi:hypothetical protein